MRTPSARSRPVSTERKSRVYVDIPRSSAHMPRSDTTTTSPSGSSLKENRFLSNSRANTDTSLTSISSGISASLKRKLSDASGEESERQDRGGHESKKPKLPGAASAASRNQRKSTSQLLSTEKTAKASAKPADNRKDPTIVSFYCHQCNKKRDMSDGIQCTFKGSLAGARCKCRYCVSCLRNRYAIRLDDVRRADAMTLSKKEKEKHVPEEDFHFKCPKCRDECNCRNCRRAKNLPPTGNLTRLARREGKESVAECLRDNPHASGIILKKEHQKEKRGTSSKSSPATSSSKKVTSRPKKPLSKLRAPKGKPAIQMPKPLWTRVPAILDQITAEARIRIREFVLRFSAIMDIGKGHLDELEAISGEVMGDEADVLVTWVSESCVKAIVVGLLLLLEEGHDSRGVSKVIKDTVKEIRGMGANLTKIWLALSTLRSGLASVSPSLFHFPDPLPPPPTVTFRNTRSVNQTSDSTVYIAISAQLVPVVAALVEMAMQSPVVREDIERGVAEEKELVKNVREATARENTRWKDMVASGTKVNNKAARAKHNQMIRDLDYAQIVAASGYIPRFSTLGQDHDGRIYYALTPGEAEREAALQLIAGKDGKVKLYRRRGGLPEEERKGMQKWPWFVAVWGKIPAGALKAEVEDEEDEIDEDSEGWWGFWQPSEITKLADWIAFRCQLEDGEHNPSSFVNSSANLKGKGVTGRASTYDSVANSLAHSREPSPLSDLSSNEDSDNDDGDDDDDKELYHGIRIDALGRPVPTRRDLRSLVQGLKDYADLLQWRLGRLGADGTS